MFKLADRRGSSANLELYHAFKYNFPSKDSRMRKKKKEWNIQKLNRTNFPWFKLSNFWKWQTQHAVHVCTCQMTPLTHLVSLVGTCLLAACFAMCPGQVSWMKWAPVPANVWILHLSRHTFLRSHNITRLHIWIILMNHVISRLSHVQHCTLTKIQKFLLMSSGG